MNWVNKYFKEHQTRLLQIANTRQGRELLSTPDGHEFTNNFSIVKVTPESVHMLIGVDSKQRPIIRAIFFPSQSFRIAQILMPLNRSLFNRAFKRPSLNIKGRDWFLPQIGLTVITKNPLGGERWGRADNQLTFSAARSKTTSSSDNLDPEVELTGNGSSSWYIGRGFEPFDTSTIPLGSTLNVTGSNTNFQGYRDDTLEHGANGFSNTDSTSIQLVNTSMGNPASYTTSDFNITNFTLTSRGSLALASTANNSYFTVNISDATLITIAGTTQIACMLGLDYSNTSSVNSDFLTWQGSARANPAKLQVTYTAPATSGASFLLNFV